MGFSKNSSLPPNHISPESDDEHPSTLISVLFQLHFRQAKLHTLPYSVRNLPLLVPSGKVLINGSRRRKVSIQKSAEYSIPVSFSDFIGCLHTDPAKFIKSFGGNLKASAIVVIAPLDTHNHQAHCRYTMNPFKTLSRSTAYHSFTFCSSFLSKL